MSFRPGLARASRNARSSASQPRVDQEHALQPGGQQFGQPLGVPRHRARREARIGVEQRPAAARRPPPTRGWLCPTDGDVVDACPDTPGRRVVQVLAAAAHDLRRRARSRAAVRGEITALRRASTRPAARDGDGQAEQWATGPGRARSHAPASAGVAEAGKRPSAAPPDLHVQVRGQRRRPPPRLSTRAPAVTLSPRPPPVRVRQGAPRGSAARTTSSRSPAKRDAPRRGVRACPPACAKSRARDAIVAGSSSGALVSRSRRASLGAGTARRARQRR